MATDKLKAGLDKELKQFLTDLGENITGDAQANLSNRKTNKTGNLYRSLSKHYLEGNKTLVIEMIDYGKWVDKDYPVGKLSKKEWKNRYFFKDAVEANLKGTKYEKLIDKFAEAMAKSVQDYWDNK